MNHKCKNWFENIAGGEVQCSLCGKQSFFTKIGISAKELILSGGYNQPDEDGKVPIHDVEMIEFFYQKELEYKNDP
jgi:hypothetical protein